MLIKTAAALQQRDAGLQGLLDEKSGMLPFTRQALPSL